MPLHKRLDGSWNLTKTITILLCCSVVVYFFVVKEYYSGTRFDQTQDQIKVLQKLEEDTNKQISALKKQIEELNTHVSNINVAPPPTPPKIEEEALVNFFADINGYNVSVWTDEDGVGEAEYIVREFQEDTYKINDLRLSDHDVVVDFGGNIGLFTVMIGLMNPHIKIYTLEPVPRNYAKLLKNIKSNGLIDRVVAINKAVTKDGRPITLLFNPNLNGETLNEDIKTTKRPAFMNSAQKVEVQSTTLGDLFRDYKISEVALMKIDCEGCEYEVVPNSLGIFDHVHKIVAEIHKNFATQEQIDEVMEILQPKLINDVK